MKLAKHLVVIFTVCLLASCTSVKFNDSYAKRMWSVVVIAPLVDENNTYVTDQYVHELATQGAIRFITPERAIAKLIELDLLDAYKTDTVNTLNRISSEFGADGFLLIDAKANGSGINRATLSEAVIRTTLYETNSLAVVASTFSESSSVFFGGRHSLNAATNDSLEELRVIFSRLNGNFKEG